MYSRFGRAMLEFLWKSDGGFSGANLSKNVSDLMGLAALARAEEEPAYGPFVAGGDQGGDFVFPKRTAPKRAMPDFDRATEEDPEDRRRNRLAEVQALKNQRILGENHAGYLEGRYVPPGKFGEYVRKTIEDENADRARLIEKLAKEKDLTVAEAERQQAEVWRKTSFEGEWIEIPQADGKFRWVRKDASAEESSPVQESPPVMKK